MTVDEETTAEEVREALTHLAHKAKRCFPVIGTKKWPTGWDKLHAQINDLLDALEGLPE